MSAPQIEVLDDAAALAQAAAGEVVRCAREAIATSGRFTFVLSGGSTPARLYALLAQEADRQRIDWSSTHVFWGDERCVPPDDPQSNYRLAREALLDRVPVPLSHVHRIRGEEEPLAAATAYEAELRTFFGHGEAPRFDLVLLGMGDNGHTASLFPGSPAIHEPSRWVLADDIAALGQWRITLTPVALNGAATTLFLVSGADKGPMLRQVTQGPYQPDRLPAQIIQPRNGGLRWLVDAAAGAALPGDR